MSFRRKSLTLIDGDGLVRKRRSVSVTSVRSPRITMSDGSMTERASLGGSGASQARVLFDYDAISAQELTAKRNEVGLC